MGDTIATRYGMKSPRMNATASWMKRRLGGIYLLRWRVEKGTVTRERSGGACLPRGNRFPTRRSKASACAGLRGSLAEGLP
jgi:hypothetical protein